MTYADLDDAPSRLSLSKSQPVTFKETKTEPMMRNIIPTEMRIIDKTLQTEARTKSLSLIPARARGMISLT